MELNDVIGLVPEDKRADVASYFDGAAIIKSPEDVHKLIDASGSNVVKSVVDDVRRSTAERSVSRFQEEKMNPLIEERVQAKLKELNPTKQPWEIELEKANQRSAALEKQIRDKEQLQTLMQLAQEKGLPSDSKLLSRFIGDDEEKTLENFSHVAGILDSWRDGALTKQRNDLTSGAGKPEQGATAGKTMKRSEFNSLSPSAKVQAIRDGVKPVDD